MELWSPGFEFHNCRTIVAWPWKKQPTLLRLFYFYMTNQDTNSTYLLRLWWRKFAEHLVHGSWPIKVNSEDDLYCQYYVGWNIIGKNKIPLSNGRWFAREDSKKFFNCCISRRVEQKAVGTIWYSIPLIKELMKEYRHSMSIK